MKLSNRIGSFVIGSAIFAVSLLPFVWTLALSLKPSGAEFDPRSSAGDWSLGAYEMVLSQEVGFGLYIWNSLVVSSVSALGAVLISGFAAFAIASVGFRYRLSTLSLILLAGLTPPVAIVGPTFWLMRRLDLTGTLAGLILPNIAYNIPIATWILVTYFSRIPQEVEDAARVDGASNFSALRRVTIPLALPGIFVALSLAFLGAWGEFMVASTVSLGRPTVSTTPVGLMGLSQAFELQWSWVSAGIVLSLIPVVILTFVFSRLLDDTSTSSAAKG